MTSSATAPASVTLRPFREGDYERLLEIRNVILPDYKASVAEFRHWDASWEADKYFKLRLAAENDEGRVVGFGQTNHMPHQFHADKYEINVQVDPASQRRGYGRALFERLLETVRERGGTLVRAEAKESLPESIAWLERRGFTEIQRYWESRLAVADFDFDAFAAAIPRVVEQGITFTTLAELGVDKPGVLRAMYELDREITRDVPLPDPVTDTSYESFVKGAVENPNFMPEAWFLAKEGERLVGLSNMWKSQELADVYYQGLTGVLREQRGRGIAMALKMHGMRFVRERGIREVRTWNNARNRPMLRINEAMGFKKEPAWVEFSRSL
ncbi:MAG TPA: GNAT family N-acetyltransferase [Chloroflexota bacterium]|nr:GNAT family N-acetyltransferase [Chloroflexota bacterium]